MVTLQQPVCCSDCKINRKLQRLRLVNSVETLAFFSCGITIQKHVSNTSLPFAAGRKTLSYSFTLKLSVLLSSLFLPCVILPNFPNTQVEKTPRSLEVNTCLRTAPSTKTEFVRVLGYFYSLNLTPIKLYFILF